VNQKPTFLDNPEGDELINSKVMKNIRIIILIFCVLTTTAKAWVYPEHRDITLRVIQKLDPVYRARLDGLWALARKGYESRLDVSVADTAQDEHPGFIDYAAFPAIAGDHSVSAENLVYNVLQTRWILHVADVAARLKNGLAKAHTTSERAAEMRASDLRFLRVDPVGCADPFSLLFPSADAILCGSRRSADPGAAVADCFTANNE
jgi:hypothetical protein